MSRLPLKSASESLWGHDDLAVVCPSCGSRALFTSPYLMLTREEAESAARDPKIPEITEDRGYFAIERFPKLFPWKDPKNRVINWREPCEKWGVISCESCPFRKKHRLSWPQEAFYKIDLPSGMLWAFNRRHLAGIRECISDPQHRGWLYSNLLPKSFFLKRNRARILRGIDELLCKSEPGCKA